MIILVSGGSSSGKSVIAEDICLKLSGQDTKLYIATLNDSSAESKQKIAKHKLLRKNNFFLTEEVYGARIATEGVIRTIHENKCNTVLIECLSNYAANAMYSEKLDPRYIADIFIDDLLVLKSSVNNIVIVTNNLFCGSYKYYYRLKDYLTVLGDINSRLGKLATVVIESLSGIAICLKGSYENIN